MQQDRTATVSMAPHPVDNVHQDAPSPLDEALRRSVLIDIGPRAEGVVYYDADRTVEVRRVVTDRTEARRILKRRAAQFAVIVRDSRTGTEYATGAVWTGTDRVVKAVAV